MRILHVIGSMDPASGGPCQGIRNSIPVLESLGVYREVVSLDNPNSSFLGDDSFPIHALGPCITSWCYSPRLMPWLKKRLHEFDVVIINGLWLYHGYAVRKALKYLKKLNDNKIPKLFIMPHGMLDPYFQKASHRKLKAIRNWLYWKVIENKCIKEAVGLLFTCETELLLARTSFKPYRPKKELDVGYGVQEPPPFSIEMKTSFLEKCPQLGERPYILFLSRIHDKKGVDILIKAFKSQYNLFKDTCTTLVIAGPGLETDYGILMQQLVKDDSELIGSVCFPGMLTGDAKWGAFYGCDAFILPSHQENFGISVAEALACAKPVLISNKVNIWKEIHSMEGGIVADDTLVGTSQMLEQFAKRSYADRTMFEIKARKTFLKYFSVKQTAQQLVEAVQ